MELENLIQKIVQDASVLKDAYTNANGVPVNYACVFCQSPEEFSQFKALAREIGSVIEETPTGPLFDVRPIMTVAGPVRLIKIRQPDSEHLERGDADFTVSDYKLFKKRYISQPGFSVLQKPTFEMMELMKVGYNVRAYFSHPPLDEQLGLKP